MTRAVRMEQDKGDLKYNRDHPGAGAAGKGDQAVGGLVGAACPPSA